MLRIHFILMRIRILDPHWKKNPDPVQEHYFKIYKFFWQKKNLSIIYLLFCQYFFFKSKFFYYLSFSTVRFGVRFFKAVFFYILTLESGSVDQHIFADPDPGVRSWPILQRFFNPLNWLKWWRYSKVFYTFIQQRRRRKVSNKNYVSQNRKTTRISIACRDAVVNWSLEKTHAVNRSLEKNTLWIDPLKKHKLQIDALKNTRYEAVP